MHDGDEKGINRDFLGRVIFAIIIVVLTPIGTYEAYHADFHDERFKLLIVLVALGIEGAHIHILANAFLHKREVVQKAREAHSAGCHFCNADPKHCFKICKKPLPICSRHLGFYGGLVGIVVAVLLVPENWLGFIKTVPWNYQLAVFIILLVIVVAEGGLGKARVIKANNPIRIVGGILSALGVAFFTMVVISVFGLLNGGGISDLSSFIPPGEPTK